MTPITDTVVVENIQDAQNALSKAQIFVANLAMSTAAQGAPSGLDVMQLSFGVTDTLRSLKDAQTAARNLNAENVNTGFNGTMDPVMQQIAIVTANGPQIVYIQE